MKVLALANDPARALQDLADCSCQASIERSCGNRPRDTDTLRPTSSSLMDSDSGTYELDIPASESDVRRLRELRLVRVDRALERINDLSATLQFPHLAQRLTTSAGFAPFTLVDE